MSIQINATQRLAAAFSESNAAKTAEDICEAVGRNVADNEGKVIIFTGTEAALKKAMTTLGFKQKDGNYLHKTRSSFSVKPDTKGTLKLSSIKGAGLNGK